jgi:transposase
MTKTTLCAVDVAAKTLSHALDDGSGLRLREVANSKAGHAAIARMVCARGHSGRVCMEATGTYHLDLALRLAAHPDIKVMVVNPRRIKEFSKALDVRSRDDVRDAKTILEFLRRMDFESWTAPSASRLELRSISRRVGQLTKQLTAEKNRLHAAKASVAGSPRLLQSLRTSIRQIQRQIAGLRTYARKLITQDRELRRAARLLLSVKGIAWVSAIQILAEIALLNPDLTPAQWVAHAALDPRRHTSGTSVAGLARISRAGNHHLRQALFMPALSLLQHNQNAQSFRDDLLALGKAKMQIVIATMRKLLRCIHGMLSSNTPFDPNRFRALAA